MPFSRAMFLTQGWNLGHLHCRQDFLPAEPPGKPPTDVMLWKHRRSLAFPSPLRNARVEASRQALCWETVSRVQKDRLKSRRSCSGCVMRSRPPSLCVSVNCTGWGTHAACGRRAVGTACSSPAPRPSLSLELTPDALQLVLGCEGGVDASTWEKLLLSG